ncbi:MAG: glycosyltransferase [Endomicrobiales bacterium]|nr:glycosyltransferase [Endomicrobiales bacterium]
MKILYFGTYDGNYLRNRIIRKGLSRLGHEVSELKRDYTGFFRTSIKLLAGWLGIKKDFNAIIVGEAGFANVPLAWLLAKLWKKRLILDAFFSLYDSFVYDRKTVRQKSMKALKLYVSEKIGCALPDAVLLDTEAHIEYFRELFKIPDGKFMLVRAGADNDIFSPSKAKPDNDRFTALYWGTFIPLHGVEYIIGAAEILRARSDIHFNLIGSGQTYARIIELARELDLKNVSFISFTNETDLVREIGLADACLGIFGDTPKTQRVVPHKAYQAIAMKKPLVTSETAAMKEIFTDKKNVLFSRAADSKSIAEKIVFLKDNPVVSAEIAENGHSLYIHNFLPEKVAGTLSDYLSRNGT